MLFLTNFLIIVGVMAVLGAYAWGVVALSEWAGDKWGSKALGAVWGVFFFLPLILLQALVMTYGA